MSDYIETTHFDESIKPTYSTGWINCNGNPEDAEMYMSATPYRTQYSYVRSWRGKQDYSMPHEFKRILVKFDVVSAKLWAKHPTYGTVNGGPHWMVFMPYMKVQPTDPVAILQKDNNKLWFDRLKAGVYAKANSPTVSIATTLAEGRETLKYLFDTLRQISALITRMRSFKGFDWSDPKYLGLPSQKWLEFRYAIMPLYLEAQSYIDAIQKGIAKREKVQDGFKEQGIVTTSTQEFAFNTTGGTNYWKWNVRETTTRKGGAALWLSAHSDANPFGTGAWDVIQGAWEATTLSFLIDWFVDVGDWLASWRDGGITVTKAYATYCFERKFDWWVSDLGFQVPCLDKQTGAPMIPTIEKPFSYRMFYMERQIGDTVKPPILPVLQPQMLSLLRAVDAVALTCSAIMRMFPMKKKRSTSYNLNM